ncbi:spore germination protein [Tissierella sp. Yu-01]|uniref:spore germination protein n=1 Tax=Tissierella sp. Yu-01 TaxID=3035694 RepID=UPI00240DD05A|nr:spore germination protein [Tissierella sp. Yu-01]WFA08515.1 spore germination protein [Tissierella sp. Yu-01]
MLKTVSRDIEQNIDYLKARFKDCDDLIYRRIEVGKDIKRKFAFVSIDGLANKDEVSQFVIERLISESEIDEGELDVFKDELLEFIAKEGISSADIKEEGNFEKLIDLVLSGETLFFIDGTDKAIVVSTRGWALRSINEPQTETVVRGPRDGFTETLRTNTALVRRRIKDTRFKIKMTKVGRRSKTDVAILYIEDIADDNLVKEVKRRLDSVDIDAVVDSSILEFLIEDDYKSPFPQMDNTERPDSVAASLYEGRVALIVDNSPFVLVMPGTLGTLMQSTEDYYSRWIEGLLMRIIRFIAAILTLLSPALYISVTAYHPGLLPTKLVYFVGASRINVPFPAVVEATLMELTMELIRQAGTRISGPIGSTIGIVGGLIIGQAAVEAGIVSNLMIIVVAITTIATFAIPSYEFGTALRICKFGFILLAGVLGLYGVMIGVILLFSHLIILTSFGVPFASPYSGLGIEQGDLKDTLLKAPIQRLWMRPGFTKPKNKKRMKREKKNG